MASKANEGFPRQQRILRPADYRAIYETGLRIQSKGFVLFVRKNELDHHRLGITVSRKVGGSVVRNRIKRWFREIYRRLAADLPNHFDLVVNAKRGCGESRFLDLRDEFISVTRRISR